MLNLVDRGLMTLLLQPIKEDLHLSDTQLGFLTGIAFGLFYATLGLPIAQWADRGNRATITSLAIGLWGLTVMSVLFVTGYVQLVFARIAAAVGESGCKPPTYSLVGDYFPRPAERTRAMAIYTASTPLALLVSLMVGGWLNELYGWRMTFFLMGIPGLLLALLIKLTMREPRTFTPRRSLEKHPAPSIKAVLVTLWRQRSYRHLCIALILVYMMGLGMGPWFAAFMIRSHGMGTAELGLWLGVIFGVGGIAGALLGGYVNSHRWFAADERRQMRLCAVMVALMVPCLVAFLSLPKKEHALLALLPLIMSYNFFLGPTYALMQRLVRDEMRATMMSVVMLLANLIGFGLGPQSVGVLSDILAPALGVDSLRYAMLMVSLIALLAGYHFWRVGRTVKEDLLRFARPLPAFSTGANPDQQSLHG
jgi:predicted MFS family arabinose efflux permease